MKKTIIAVAIMGIFAFAGLVKSVQASTFLDDFNDGNTDGWISAPACTGCDLGNWRLSDGAIIEDYGRDAYMFLLNDYPISSQSVEARILNHDNGYAGITIWFRDVNNWVQIFFPYWNTSFGISEMVDGNSIVTTYPYQFGDRT